MREAIPDRSVCAVVVNWNGWRDTIACLDSLLALEVAPAWIVVCDNGSSDGSLAELADWRQARGEVSRVHLLELGHNAGYAGALNAGVHWARLQRPTRFFWLLNNDLEVQPGAMRALLDAHAR